MFWKFAANLQENTHALQLCWNRTSAWVFSYKFAAYFQNTFSTEYLWMDASEITISNYKQRYNKTSRIYPTFHRPFSITRVEFNYCKFCSSKLKSGAFLIHFYDQFYELNGIWKPYNWGFQIASKIWIAKYIYLIKILHYYNKTLRVNIRYIIKTKKLSHKSKIK